jgi:hypothetical protein
MQLPGAGLLGRLGEKVLGWIILGLLVGLGILIWRMPAETKAAIWSAAWRGGVWVVLTGAIPWTARLYLRRVMEAGTNWAGALLLAGLLTADVVAALALMTGWPSGGWGWAAALTALAVAGLYNYLVTEYLTDRLGD